MRSTTSPRVRLGNDPAATSEDPGCDRASGPASPHCHRSAATRAHRRSERVRTTPSPSRPSAVAPEDGGIECSGVKRTTPSRHRRSERSAHRPAPPSSAEQRLPDPGRRGGRKYLVSISRRRRPTEDQDDRQQQRRAVGVFAALMGAAALVAMVIAASGSEAVPPRSETPNTVDDRGDAAPARRS